MVAGGSIESSDGVLARLLASAESGGVPHLARLLDSAAFSVAVFERSAEGIRVAYLNSAASAHAAIGGAAAMGRPAVEVFPNVNTAMIEQLLAGEAAGGATPMNLRGMLPGGSAWSLDAIRLGPDRLVILAEELGEAVSSRHRLEALLGAMDVIWRPIDFHSMPAQIAEQAAALLPDVDVVVCMLGEQEPYPLEIAATNNEALRAAGQLDAGSLAARAARSAEPIEVTLPGDLMVLLPSVQPQGARAVRAVPLNVTGQMAGGRPSLGVLVLLKRSSAPFTDAERRLIDQFGRLVALALHRAELLRDARDSARRLRLTLDLAMAFASSLSPREVVQLLLERTLDAVEAERATLSRIEGDEVVIEATYARSGELTWVGRRYALDYIDRQPLIKRALQTRQPVVGGRLDVDGAAPEFREDLSAMAHTANLPLMLQGELGGLLVVSRSGGEAFTAGDVSILELMGNAAMLALRNARLFEDLQVASAAKTDFLNMAAHELRTPVTVIKGYASMLGAGVGTEQAVAVIEQKAAELAKLVDALLLASRVQSGSLGDARSAFDIIGCVREAVARGESFAGLSGGKLTAELPDGSLTALGNPERVARILDNLINNAIAYSDGPPRVQVRVIPGDGHVDVDVEDHGRGIAAAKQADVFNEFVRIEDADAPSPPGAGLGLYISRRLAETMGGRLTLERSAPGEGSVFRLRLEQATS